MKNNSINKLLFLGNLIFGTIAIISWIVAFVLNKPLLWTWTFNAIQIAFLIAQYVYIKIQKHKNELHR